MKRKPPLTLRKERRTVITGVVACVLATFALNALSRATHNAILAWLATATFCIAIILAIVVLPMLMKKHEKAGDKEPDERW